MKKSEETEQNNELKVQGACMFCGQTCMVNDKIGGMTEEERDEAATVKCSCVDAKSYVRKKERRKKRGSGKKRRSKLKRSGRESRSFPNRLLSSI